MVSKDVAKQKSKRVRITTKAVQETENLAPSIPTVVVKPEQDEDAWGDDGLTTRQRAFVDALVGPAGGNASKAAEMAGYASDNRKALCVTACRTLALANVQEALARRLAVRKNSPEWAVAGLIDIASASLANFITVGEDGKPIIDWEKAAVAGGLGQIREYKEEGFDSPSDGPVVFKRTIKLHDRRAALETLLKLHGVLKDRIEHTGKDGGPIKTEFDLTKLSADELRALRELRLKAATDVQPSDN